MTPEGESDATDGDRTDGASVGASVGASGDGDTGSPLVDRWLALDRGWQALALGLGIVAAHAAGQLAGLL
ncbi:hypothetical protein [Halorubrum sp. HHNYT27]|uniref:hypothetical protein n=1 Tax=Halorubrum sp. HHNYT27 TaxID=3402275 RepID=UPI003EB874F8